MLTLKPGVRLYCAVDTTELIVIKAPAGQVDLTLGGHPAVLNAEERTEGAVAADHDGGVAMGKRYVDADNSIEVLVTKAGAAIPALAGTPLLLKDAKPLPSSD